MVQLHRLPELNARRAVLVARYRELLANTPLQPLAVPDYPHLHSNHLFMVRVDAKRCGVIVMPLCKPYNSRKLARVYFRAAHTQKYYREKYPAVSLPDTEWNSACLCTLPLFPDMTDDDLERVVRVIHQVLESNRV